MHPLDCGEYSFDSNSIFDFVKSGSLALLDRLFEGRALLSDFVINELKDANIECQRGQVISLIEESEIELFNNIRRNNPPLGIGEVGAIVLARLRGAGLITNDRQARRAAAELGIRVFGSLAILQYAAETAVITGEEAVRILSEMIIAGSWLSDELVENFRRDVLNTQGRFTRGT